MKNRHHPASRGRPAAVIGLLLSLAFAAVACEGARHMATAFIPAGWGKGDFAEPRLFPDDAEPGADLDIEIVRPNRKQVAIDNRTARRYEGATLWLNREYGVTLDSIAIGRGQHVDLADFVNRHGERFPTGSFLEPDKTQHVVAADLESAGTMHHLAVRLVDDWQRPPQ